MKQLVLLWLVAFAAVKVLAVGAVQISEVANINNTGNWMVTANWTGDAANGTVPAATTALNQVQGYNIVQVQTVPQTPAPTANYTLTITDVRGFDILTGQGGMLSSTLSQGFQVAGNVPPLLGSLTFNISGQSAAGAKGQVLIWFQKPVTITAGLAHGGGGGGSLGLPSCSAQIQYLRTKPNSGASNVLECASLAPLYATDYNFPAQSPGGTLTAGSNTITLHPVPLGVNGNDTNHWLYVSGGLGTAEPCLINGGSGTSGAASGTISLNCSNIHSGAWTVQSSTSGIQESLQAAKTAGGGIAALSAATTYNIYSQVNLWTNTCLAGQGTSSIIRLPNNVFTTSPQWYGSGTANSANVIIAGTLTVGVTNLCIRNLTIDTNGANQPTLTGADAKVIYFINATFSLIEGVNQINVPATYAILNMGLWGNSDANIVTGNKMINLPCVGISGAHGINVSGSRNRIENNYIQDACGAGYGAQYGQENYFAGNTYSIVSSSVNTEVQVYYSDSAAGTTFVGNECLGSGGTTPVCYAALTDVATPSTNTTFIGNVARNCNKAYQLGATNANVTQVVIQGGQVINCPRPMDYVATPFQITELSVSDVPGLYAQGYVAFRPVMAGANQDVNIVDYGVAILNASGAYSIGGFNDGFEGRRLRIINVAGVPMTIVNNDAGSLAANRIFTQTGGNVVVTAPHTSAEFVYSALCGGGVGAWCLFNY